MELLQRFEIARLMREEYKDFRVFAVDALEFLGFSITQMQLDIAEYMQNGPRLRMVMAQRGEAKSTLAAIRAVWGIIQDPKTRVLIISAGEDKANEVASVVIRMILHWDKLDYLRPDRRMGDRTGADAFDVHYALKGVDQSPSVACIGITGNLQGRRADLLIPDDIESTKNGLTVGQREHLLNLTREFSSINTHGDILYLGTPQTKDSVYNTLPSRGFQVRIWPGRFPTPEERERYGELLAPYIADRLDKDPSLGSGAGLDGTRGKPTDPDRFNEDALIEKELDQGPEGFQLQYMLDTSLSDELRQQLKIKDFVIANFEPERVPEIIVWRETPKNEVKLPVHFPVHGVKLYHPESDVRSEWVPLPKERMMYIDPAGGGADEIGFAVSCTVGPYIHILDAGGLHGGLTNANADKLIEVIKDTGVTFIRVESNMGHGLFELTLIGLLEKAKLKDVGVQGEYSTGQKERRIISSLVSAMQRHRIVMHKQVLESDIKYCKQYSLDKRKGYSLWYQLQSITTDRGSLVHDDRVEALAGAVRHWKAVLALDEEKASEKRVQAEAQEFIQNPMGYTDTDWKSSRKRSKGVLGRLRYLGG